MTIFIAVSDSASSVETVEIGADQNFGESQQSARLRKWTSFLTLRDEFFDDTSLYLLDMNI
jgi:hypothetical protein